MGTVRLICLLFSIFETFGQLNSKENDALQANNLLASTTSGKVSNVLRDILNQESLVRFSMVQKIQSLVMDVADSKNDNEYMKKKLNDVTEKLQALDVKNRQMEDENESLRQELKILSDHYNHTIESLQTLHDKEFLFLKNETSRLQNENDGTTLDAIEIKKELGEFNKAFDYLNLSKGEIKKEFHQNIQGLQMEVEENRNSNQAQKLRLSDVQTLLTEYIQNVNESRTAFQKQIEVMDKRMENLERHGTLNARVQVVEDSLQKFSLSLDDIRADQKVYMNNKHLRRIVTESLTS
ncbi:paramyosin-like [Saccostrea cucullata]|uniref:paramyosin-like n=1 Tax=Saccostrea cuccullata TaxID=36930 RepID=UPI002ED084D4